MAGRPKLKLLGRRFNRLKVIEFIGVRESYPSKSQWKCLCNCGNTVIVLGDNLMTGNTKSCGCYRKYVSKRTVREKFKTWYNRGTNGN